MAIDVELPEFKLPKLKDLPNIGKRKIKEYRRVLSITKKPSGEEFKSISKVTGMGMIIIGLAGFVIFMIAQVFQ